MARSHYNVAADEQRTPAYLLQDEDSYNKAYKLCDTQQVSAIARVFQACLLEYSVGVEQDGVDACQFVEYNQD